ncbi:MAG: methyl-accepting chemotaxis protein [Cyanobacteria bacterium P01_A01_bin.45]
MAADIENYLEKYQQARKAYVNQEYEVAASLIDEVVEKLADDENTHLLRAHIYYVLQKFDIAKDEYKAVLDISQDPDIIGFAQDGIENIRKYQESNDVGQGKYSANIQDDIEENQEELSFSDESSPLFSDEPESEDLPSLGELSGIDFGFEVDEKLASDPKSAANDLSSGDNPFAFSPDEDTSTLSSDASKNVSENVSENNSDNSKNDDLIDPFTAISQDQEKNNDSINQDDSALELPAFWQEELSEQGKSNDNYNTDEISNISNTSSDRKGDSQDLDSPFNDIDLTDMDWENQSNPKESVGEYDVNADSSDSNFSSNNSDASVSQNFDFPNRDLEDDTLLMRTEGEVTHTESSLSESLGDSSAQDLAQASSENWLRAEDMATLEEIPEVYEDSLSNSHPESSSTTSLEHDNNFRVGQQQPLTPSESQDISLGEDSSFDLEAFESAFGSEDMEASEDTNTILGGNISQKNNIEFLDDFDEFDDLGKIPGLDTTNGESSFVSSQLNSEVLKNQDRGNTTQTLDTPSLGRNETSESRDSELFSISSSQESIPVFTQTDADGSNPQVSVEQGTLGFIENAPLKKKQWLVAGTVGAVSMLVVASVTFVCANFFAPKEHRVSVQNTGLLMALAAGVSGVATSSAMSRIAMAQIKRTTEDLQTQFNEVRLGNLNVQATVYSEDEMGKLASGFNEMARVIFTTTNEATRKAQEQEEAKENLQRQVIRLLDDVEGAARGDLTVQAEVTADVLGAVADAFNLTIQNLRDIVGQVKVAAREVTKGATNSETFARALSSDALRQAEELAVTLNSVQVMTDSIQRVAEAAREAEAVARDASDIALKGGEAVENTVAGILEIRETVAETTRKVKRLAESSQEISKIVALISQIASRTNLLALNASIEAARAGEAGRGFAIVADEVRQLADKSAKSLKEIEQIVLQIQSETGSVMTAMEEGTQQVIKGTQLAEEAKYSLENIIQTAKRIDILVRSITADTVDQTETSRAVAHVMQSVELTAQETSQEAQRVSGALQHLVGVSRDLISSVERFRVETVESK